MSWQPLPWILQGCVIASFHPLNLGGSDIGSIPEVKADEAPSQRLTVGDEVYVLEELIKVDGERWYRGYIVLRRSIQDVPLNVFNMPITSLSCFDFPLGPPSYSPNDTSVRKLQSSQTLETSASGVSPLMAQRNKFTPPVTEPIMCLGIFPAASVHIRGKAEALKDPIGDLEYGNVEQLHGVMDTVRENEVDGDENAGGSGTGSDASGIKPENPQRPLAGLGLTPQNGRREEELSLSGLELNGSSSSSSPLEAIAAEEEDHAHQRTGSRVTLAEKMLSNEHIARNSAPAPIPVMRSDYSSLAGQTEPLIDHIAGSIREWTPRLPVLLRTSAYKTFENVSRLLKLLISARTRFLAGDMTRAERRDLRGDCVGYLRDGEAALALDVKLIDEESGRLLVTSLEKGKDTNRTKWVPPMQLVKLEQQEMDRRMRETDHTHVGSQANGKPPTIAVGPLSTPTKNGNTASPLGKKFSIAKKLKEAEPSLRVEFQALTASLCLATESLELFLSIYDRGLKAFITEEWHLLVDHLGMVQAGDGSVDVSDQRAKRTMFETIGSEKSTSFLVVKVVKMSNATNGIKTRTAVAMGVCGLAALSLQSKGTSEKVVELFGIRPEVRLADLHERLAAKANVGMSPLQGSLILNLRLERQSAHRRLRSISLTRSFHVDDGRDELYIKLAAVHIPDSVIMDDMAGPSAEVQKVHCRLSLQAADGTKIPESLQLGGNSDAWESSFDCVINVDASAGYLGYLLKFRNLEATASLACSIGQNGQKPDISLLPLVRDNSYITEGVHRLHFGGLSKCWVEARVHLCSSARVQNKVLAGLLRYHSMMAADRQEILKLVNFVDPDILYRHRCVCLTALLRIVDADSVPDPERRAAFGCAMIMLNQFEDLPDALAKERIPAGPIFQVLGSSFQADKRMDAIRALPRVLDLHLKQGISASDGHFPTLFRDLMRKLTGVIRDGGEQTLAFRITALVVFPTKIVAEAFPQAEAVECLSAFIEAFNSRDCPPLIQEARLSLLERMLLEVPAIALQLVPVIIRAIRPTLLQPEGGNAVRAARRKALDLIGVAIDTAISEGNQPVIEYLAQAGLLILLPLRDLPGNLVEETSIDALIAILFLICTEAGDEEQDLPFTDVVRWSDTIRHEALIGTPACMALVCASLVRLCQVLQARPRRRRFETRSIAVNLVQSLLVPGTKSDAVQIPQVHAISILRNAIESTEMDAGKRIGLDRIFRIQTPGLDLALAAACPERSCSSAESHSLKDDWATELIMGMLHVPSDRAHGILASAARAIYRLNLERPSVHDLRLVVRKLQDLLNFDRLSPPAAWHGLLEYAHAERLSRTVGLCLRVIRSQLAGCPTSDLHCAAALLDMEPAGDQSPSIHRALQVKDFEMAARLCGQDAEKALAAGDHFVAAHKLRQQSDILLQAISQDVPPMRFWRTNLRHGNANEDKYDLNLIWALPEADSLGNLMSDFMRAFPSAEIKPIEEPPGSVAYFTPALHLEEVEPLSIVGDQRDIIKGRSFQTKLAHAAPGVRRHRYTTTSILPGPLPHSPIYASSVETLDRGTIDAELFTENRATLNTAVWRVKLAIGEGEQATARRKAISNFSRALDSLVDDEDLVAAMKPYIALITAHDHARRACYDLLQALDNALTIHGDLTKQTDLRGFHATLVQLFNVNFGQALSMHNTESFQAASSPSAVSSPGSSSPLPASYLDSPTDRSMSPSPSFSPSFSRPRSSLSHTLSEKLPDLKRRWGSLRSKPQQRS